MREICQFMKYRNDEDNNCTSPSCIECDIYKALEKQIPKKLVISANNELECPYCHSESEQINGYRVKEPQYCEWCGQKLKW